VKPRDEAFEAKMAEVLCFYQEVAVLRAVEPAHAKAQQTAGSNVAIISYDEQPGIQAIQHSGRSAPGGGPAPERCARP
jgi:hypothetical protein